MASIFSKIVNRDIPAYIIAENDSHLSFLDINPLTVGHALVIPKQEVDYIFDLSDQEFLNLQAFSKKVAKAISSTIDCKRVGVAVVGLEVPHAHIHLIPINEMDDMNFSRPKLSPTTEELTQTALAIKEKFDSL